MIVRAAFISNDNKTDTNNELLFLNVQMTQSLIGLGHCILFLNNQLYSNGLTIQIAPSIQSKSVFIFHIYFSFSFK